MQKTYPTGYASAKYHLQCWMCCRAPDIWECFLLAFCNVESIAMHNSCHLEYWVCCGRQNAWVLFAICDAECIMMYSTDGCAIYACFVTAECVVLCARHTMYVLWTLNVLSCARHTTILFVIYNVGLIANVCVCVCMYACMHACMYVCVCMYAYACKYVCTRHMRLYACMYECDVCMYVYARVYSVACI